MESLRKTFKRNLVRLRTERDWSQAVLAEKIGVETGAIGHWEAGSRFPKPENIDSLCSVFKCSPHHILTEGMPEADIPVNKALEAISEALGYETPKLKRKQSLSMAPDIPEEWSKLINAIDWHNVKTGPLDVGAALKSALELTAKAQQEGAKKAKES